MNKSSFYVPTNLIFQGKNLKNLLKNSLEINLTTPLDLRHFQIVHVKIMLKYINE